MTWDILALEVGEFYSNFCPGGGDIDPFCLDALSTHPPFPRTEGVGGGGGSIDWCLVHNLLATFTIVCYYRCWLTMY